MSMTTKWGEITAGEIVSPMQGELISGHAGSILSGLSTDSREITPGQIFLALKGERFDGHDFVEKAVKQGASGIVIEKDRVSEVSADSGLVTIAVTDTLKALGDLAAWWRKQHDVRVAAITGSAGKTTTKEMTADILGIGARTLKNRGNLNNLIGLPLTLLRLEEGDRRAVLEMGMNVPGEIGRLTEIADPDIGLITNVARAHLEGLGDIMSVARAKTELVEKISSEGQVILNGEDELLMKTASRFRKKTVTYGIRSGNEIRAEKIQNLGDKGLSFELQYHGNSVPIKLRVPGSQNLFNALAASAIAICMKEPFDHISKGLRGFKGIKGRFMLIHLPGDITIVDDTYNSNPSSLKAAIDSIRELAAHGRRVIIGLGEMLELGNETVSAHLEAGGMVAELGASYLFSMGDHSREMVTGALDKGFPTGRAIVVESHDEMKQRITDVMKDGDLILLKGSRKMGLERVSEGLKERWSGEG